MQCLLQTLQGGSQFCPVPRRFYVQLDSDDLHMLVIPPAFDMVLKQFLRRQYARNKQNKGDKIQHLRII